MDNMETKDLNAEELEKVQDAELDDVSGGNDGSYGGEGMYCPFCRSSHSGISHVFTIVKGNYKVFRCQKQAPPSSPISCHTAIPYYHMRLYR